MTNGLMASWAACPHLVLQECRRSATGSFPLDQKDCSLLKDPSARLFCLRCRGGQAHDCLMRRRLSPSFLDGLAAKPRRLCDIRSFCCISWRYNGVRGRKVPSGTVVLRRQSVIRHKVALEHLSLKTALHAGHSVMSDRQADGNSRFTLRFHDWRRFASVQQRHVDRLDQPGQITDRNAVLTDMSRDNIAGESDQSFVIHDFPFPKFADGL